LFFNAADGEIPIAEAPQRMRIFSSGPRLISPRVLPVPNAEIIRQLRQNGGGLPYDNFEAPLEELGLLFNGRPLHRLLPKLSLHKWLWVSRVTLEIAERALIKLDRRINVHYDFPKQLREFGIRDATSLAVRAEMSKVT